METLEENEYRVKEIATDCHEKITELKATVERCKRLAAAWNLTEEIIKTTYDGVWRVAVERQMQCRRELLAAIEGKDKSCQAQAGEARKRRGQKD